MLLLQHTLSPLPAGLLARTPGTDQSAGVQHNSNPGPLELPRTQAWTVSVAWGCRPGPVPELGLCAGAERHVEAWPIHMWRWAVLLQLSSSLRSCCCPKKLPLHNAVMCLRISYQVSVQSGTLVAFLGGLPAPRCVWEAIRVGMDVSESECSAHSEACTTAVALMP